LLLFFFRHRSEPIPSAPEEGYARPQPFPLGLFPLAGRGPSVAIELSH
jgi:hypothetical protein